jgi:hypothetical protein
MPVTINGTTGVVTPGATIGSINGILKSSSGVVSQAVAGSDYGQLTLATAQSASGTSVDFTGIPSWAKRITVMFNGVSTSGTSSYLIQLGTSGGIENSGYLGAVAGNSSSVSTTANSTGLMFVRNPGSPEAYSGISIISSMGSNIWSQFGVAGSSVSVVATMNCGGSKTLSGTLDRIRITTVNGTDTFDAGTINISYE